MHKEKMESYKKLPGTALDKEYWSKHNAKKMYCSTNLPKHEVGDLFAAADNRILTTEKVHQKLLTALKNTEVVQLFQVFEI